MADFHRAVAKLRRWGNDEFNIFLDHRPVLRRFIVITLETIFLFAALGARALAHPRELLFQKHLALVLDHRIGGLALGLVQEVVGVVAGVRKKLAVTQLKDAGGDAIQEIAIVRDNEKRSEEHTSELQSL